MASYTAAGDLEVGGVEERRVVVVEGKPGSGRLWRACGALLLTLTLCLGAVVLVWSFNGRPAPTDLPGQAEARSAAGRTEPHQTLSRISSGAKAAIHLEAGSLEDEGPGAALLWRKDQGQAFDQGGFLLANNRVVIPKTGLYFVYSQASFRVSCEEDVDGGGGGGGGRGPTPLSHRVWRLSDSVGGRASLMSAVRSACQSPAQDGRGWYNAIYLGAVFQLRTGDELWTETNQLSELETDEGRTFFGVFAL